VGLDLLQHRQGDVEVVSAEQQPGWSLEPLALKACRNRIARTRCRWDRYSREVAAARARSQNGSAYSRASASENSPAGRPRRRNHGMKPRYATTCSPRIGVATSAAYHARSSPTATRVRPHPRAGRVAQQQPINTLGMLQAEEEAGEPTPVMTDHMGPGKAERIQQPHRIAGEGDWAVVTARCLAPSEAAQVGHEQAIVATEALDDAAPATTSAAANRAAAAPAPPSRPRPSAAERAHRCSGRPASDAGHRAAPGARPVAPARSEQPSCQSGIAA
jgi:hypothetical protein